MDGWVSPGTRVSFANNTDHPAKTLPVKKDQEKEVNSNRPAKLDNRCMTYCKCNGTLVNSREIDIKVTLNLFNS